MPSIFGFLFGTPKKEVAPTTIDTLGALRQQETHLEKRSNFLESQIKLLIEQAMLHKDNKPKALFFLKKKHLLDGQLRTTQGMLEKIMQQRLSLELSQVQAQAIKAIASTTKALKASTVDIAEAQDVMDAFGEHVVQSEEIGRLFAEPTPGMEGANDAAERELEEMLVAESITSVAPPAASKAPPVVDTVEQELLKLSECLGPAPAPVPSSNSRVALPA